MLGKIFPFSLCQQGNYEIIMWKNLEMLQNVVSVE